MATKPLDTKPPAKTLPQTTKSPRPRRYVDEQTFRTLVRLSTVADGLAIISSLGAYAIIPAVRMNDSYVLLIAGLALLGALYNVLIWRRWHDRKPLIAIQFAILPPILTLLIAAGFTGGVSSDWYMFWLIALVCSGITGSRSVLIAGGITGAFFASHLAFLSRASDFSFGGPFEIIATLAALVAGYLIGKEVDRMVRMMQLAEGLTHQLDSSELKDRLMMSAIADAVVAVDTQANVVIFNDAAQRITGWDNKSAMGVAYNTIFKLKDQNDAEISSQTDPFKQVLSSGKPLTTDAFYMLNHDNQKINFSISVAPTLDARGEVGGVIAVFHDISDQKALARERNEFISTASHEMRTPVAAIEGYLSMSMNSKLATIDDRAMNFINKAHDSALHLGKLFKDLLSVTKIEDNRMIINKRIFNLSELVTQVVAEMDIIAKQKQLKILTHFGSNSFNDRLVVAPLYQVNADPDRIREVIANLIDNAVKYSAQGTIDVTLKADKNFATFSVSDQGMGISAEEQKHLFQKFYRVSNSLTREIGGTGLGLYIARSIIERFGGHISVDAQEGKGSTFTFTLPLVHEV